MSELLSTEDLESVIRLTGEIQHRSGSRVELIADKMETSEPVPGFPMRFTWQKGLLYELFDRQVDLINQDIARARSAGRLVVYISCPISSRGGGHAATNVEIALHTQNRLQKEWGDRFWFLNPAEYQMESRAGTGLILRHARQMLAENKIQLDEGQTLEMLLASLGPQGGDYMRMWTRVLVEDQIEDNTILQSNSDGTFLRKIPDEHNLGGCFAGYYFVGPTDAKDFFSVSGAKSISAGVEAYFARKYSVDPFFRRYFSPNGLDAENIWFVLRQDFLRFYSHRYGANYSLGSHDEWNIWCVLNKKRIEKLGVGSQISGYFEGHQIDLSSSEYGLSRGYAVPT